jgi:hypothetical protein
VSSFVYPKPGERGNSSAIPVPPHTLIALVAGALAWEITTNELALEVVPPQLSDATMAALAALDDAGAQHATQWAGRLMQDRIEAEQG